MNCKNCHEPFGAEGPRVFQQVVVCATCFTQVSRTLERIEKDLRGCILLVSDKMRELLIEGKFQLAAQQSNEGLDKRKLLETITSVYSQGHAPAREPGTEDAVPVRQLDDAAGVPHRGTPPRRGSLPDGS